MKQLFPIEIQEYTVQNFYKRRQVTSKIIYAIIIFLFAGIIISLPFIYVDVTTQSRGVVRSAGENNGIQSAIYAEIDKTVLFENKNVKKGDTLIWFKTEELDEQIKRLRGKQAENSMFIEDMNLLLSDNNHPSTSRYKTELSQYQAKFSEQEVSFKQAQYEYELSKKLYDKGVETQYNFQQAKSHYNAVLLQLRLIRQQQKNIWQTEKTRLEYENEDLLSQLLQLEKRKSQYVITAPISGNIVQFNGVQTGNFVSPGQTIAQITSNDSLLVECYVSPLDIGYVRREQRVRFQIDSFDYRQWGLLEGSVMEILPDVISLDNKPFFRVRCLTSRDYLELANGYRGTVQKGMTVTARFFLTRRSLYQLLFDKIDNWMNPKLIHDNYGNKN
jgi:HlyD family secretion protein